jgi:hypothetical protein
MDAWVWIVIVIAVLLVAGLVAWAIVRGRRTRMLQERFGPEYERQERISGRRDAEADLRARQTRRESLDIRPLSSGTRDRYATEWSAVQSRFVDDPKASLADADRLVMDLMRERGYPMDDFDQRASDISVDHPTVVGNYRSAHEISINCADDRASTEDMRQGLVHYRALFEELLEVGPDERRREAS